MFTPPRLFGVTLPQTTKFLLRERLRRLKSTSKKHVLYFHYSEFLLRANRNPWYKETLNRATLSAIDGKGLHWALWTSLHPAPLPRLYALFLDAPVVVRCGIFLVLFCAQLGLNFFSGLFSLLLNLNYTQRTGNEVILGRDFIYDLLRIGRDKGWKTLIISGSRQADELTHKFITNLFPGLDLKLWTRESTSLLMRDKVLPEFAGQTLNNQNVTRFFPDLGEAKKYIQKEKPQLILVCLGGASGRQEFFIDNLYQDENVDFVLATGLGAAVDHLGGGSGQRVAPKWMTKTGLEWLFRFLTQPGRRGRIWDSIFTLYWWTTVEQFQKVGRARKTVVNLVDNLEEKVLLVERKNLVPGDIDWGFVQGGVGPKEKPEQAGLREIVEEVGLEPGQLELYRQAEYTGTEEYPVSFARFFFQGAKYRRSQKFLNYVTYTGQSVPKTNWENRQAKWFEAVAIKDYLALDKHPDWQKGSSKLQQHWANRGK